MGVMKRRKDAFEGGIFSEVARGGSFILGTGREGLFKTEALEIWLFQ